MNAAGEIKTERQGHIFSVTIDRPAKLNAFTIQMYQAFGEVFHDISNDESIRCVLLRSEGYRAFCVGSDIDEFRESLGEPGHQIKEARMGRNALDIMNACPHPIVVAIKGVCVGGGLEIASGCDIRVAAKDSRYGIPIKNLGMHAEIEDLETMVRALGSNMCLDLLLTGRMLEAEEALVNGFIHRLIDPLLVDGTAMSIANEIATGAPLAARWHKRAIRAFAKDAGNTSNMAEEALHCYRHRDFAEGCAAFIEKREPMFNGS